MSYAAPNPDMDDELWDVALWQAELNQYFIDVVTSSANF